MLPLEGWLEVQLVTVKRLALAVRVRLQKRGCWSSIKKQRSCQREIWLKFKGELFQLFLNRTGQATHGIPPASLI